ncbi:AbrB/MazE/SpoVT family DNA-binding domain-containing protein [Paracoccus laeviglucosivorans]|uniref:Transcriptional regulator/antitoxin, MazE n=1 Tax=Paracoccus laeviglucosivorans TaxID=1197861 RepID=A0A521FQ81_9RHOB|nr:AbrB/MazE/SpoVT family DNA-binding domain-containing protein [Paracoccus laeviglucosivorans]SMO97621.1 transcriptional regulator/antitoxin, MazE [Paracoccus laeviglucosivorans]
MQIAKWGNSLAVRLPAKLVAELGLQAGDQVQIEAAPGRLTVARPRSTDDILADLDRFRGRLPGEFRFDRDAANAR